MSAREGAIERKTRETAVRATVRLEGTGEARVASGIRFLDHMLAQVARHAGIDIDLSCEGDLDIDDHHTAEDCALTFGQAMDQALGDRRGIRRFGTGYAPLDESLSRVVIDLGGRPCSVVELPLRRDGIGGLASENVIHFFRSFAVAARASLHVDLLRGENDHHKVESAFKAFGLALKEAVRLDGAEIPSTKGVLV